MVLAGAAPLILAARFQRIVALLFPDPGPLVEVPNFGLQDLHPDPAHPRRSPGEVTVDDAGIQAHRLEDLGAPVALDRGDAHLGHDLDYALVDRLDVLLPAFLIRLARNDPIPNHAPDGLQGQIGMHGAGAVADEQGEVVDFPRLAALHHQGGPRSQPFPDQVVVYARNRQQGRNGSFSAAGVPIRQHYDIAT